MRLLLAGGRCLSDAAPILAALDAVRRKHRVSVLIHGGHAVLGAVAEDWARAHDIDVIRYPANWKLHGRRAEALRNAFMLADSRPDLVLVLPGGADTADLIDRARAGGLPVLHGCDAEARDPVTRTASILATARPARAARLHGS
ncbi:DUF2493 domain-containing protein [Rhodoplanes azumiensis]|uniref:DUF2493 domain-containing protein n=1 Tax=Rhodoplanes azumiensis TaxID=1897628 RepID=A0ABW5AH65_9BRAD